MIPVYQEVSVANLTTLCRWHHREHHEGTYTITTTRDGTLTFRKPDGTPIPHAPQPPTPAPAPAPATPPAPPIDPTAITPTWKGDRLNLGYTIAGLLHHHPPKAA